MFTKRPTPATPLEEAILTATLELKSHDADSDEYRNIVNQLTALNAIQNTKTDRVSKDTLAIVLGNIAGILVLVGYEQKHIMTSKALSFVGKFK